MSKQLTMMGHAFLSQLECEGHAAVQHIGTELLARNPFAYYKEK